MTADASDTPLTRAPPSKAKTWLLRRISWSTWLVMLLAAAVMALVEIPGRRTGPLTYAHGWPWTYLRRDYAITSLGSNGPAPLFMTGAPTASPLGLEKIPNVQRFGDGRAYLDPIEFALAAWPLVGWPWEVEQKLSPWTLDGAAGGSVALFVLDMLTAALIVLASGWTWQAWRRRHPRRSPHFQFRLRTLLIFIALVSLLCARCMVWRDACVREAAVYADSLKMASTRERELETYRGWTAPAWLPESLAKLLPFAAEFECVTGLSASGTLADDDHLKMAQAFTGLQVLHLWNSQATAVGLESLRRFSRLTTVNVLSTKLSDASLEQLAALTQLTRLSLPVAGNSRESIGRLLNLRKLQVLKFEGVASDDFVEALGGLPQLEELDLQNSSMTRVVFVSCPRLRALNVSGNLPSEPLRVLKSVRLESLPELGSCCLWTAAACEVRLDNLPKLSQLTLDGATLDATARSEIVGLPNLESLSLGGVVAVPAGERFDLHGMARLQTLYFGDEAAVPALRLDDLPSLATLNLGNNPILRTLELGKLPSLEEFEMLGCPRVVELDVRGAPRIKRLTATDENMGVDSRYDTPSRPHRRTFLGLGQLSQLETLELGWTSFEPATLADIGQLKNLTSLNLNGARFSEPNLDWLSSLANLTSLTLNSSDVTDAALTVLRKMPALSSVGLWGTAVSDDALKKLATDRPELNVGTSEKNISGAPFGGGFGAAPAPRENGFELAIAGARRGRSLEVAPSWPREINDQNLKSLSDLIELEALDISDSHVTDAGLASLEHLDQLRRLNLSKTSVTDAGLARLAGLHELRELNLGSTQIQGEGLQHLAGLSHLRALDLSDTDVTDDTLANLQYFPKLEKLSLASTRITGRGLASLKSLPRLKELNIELTDVTDVDLASLKGLSQLEVLWLGGDLIKGPGLDQLRDLPHLTTLELVSDAQSLNRCGEHLAQLSRVRTLRLEQTHLPLQFLRNLARMEDLEELYLPTDQLNDQQLKTLRSFPRLRKLYIPKDHWSNSFEALQKALPKLELADRWSNTAVFAPISLPERFWCNDGGVF